MNKKKKHHSYIAFILSVAILLCTGPFTARYVHAEEKKTSGELPAGLKPIQVVEVDSFEEDADAAGEYRLFAKSVAASADFASYSGTYCYSRMNENERSLYDKLTLASDALMSNTVDCRKNGNYCYASTCTYAPLTKAQALSVAWAFYYQNPQYFFYDSYVLTSSTELALVLYSDFAAGSARAEAVAEFQGELRLILNELDQTVNAAANDYEKEYAIYRFVVDRLNYAHSEFDQSVYSCFIRSEDGSCDTVCAGFSKLFCMLANHYGLPAVNAAYSPKAGSGGGHAWSKVYLYGGWYNVDTTWAKTGQDLESYLNRSDAVFQADGHKMYLGSSFELNFDEAWLPEAVEDYADEEHHWAETAVDSEPSCEAYGLVTYTCIDCGEEKTVTLPALGHLWGSGAVTKAPSCTGYGESTVACTRPGCSEKIKTPIAPLGHTSDSGTVTKAGCTKNGKIVYKCKTCGKILKKTVLKKTGHTWDSGKIKRKATETKTGLLVYTCKKCGATKKETLPKLPATAKNVSVSYQTHVQNIGWQNFAKNGETAGTTGASLRLEAVKLRVSGDSKLGVKYRTHVQHLGWQSYVANGTMNGSTGMSLRLEAVEMELTGAHKSLYDIYYRVHVQNYGWLDWAKNGAPAGSEGLSLRMEAMEVVVLPKGTKAPGKTAHPFIQ